MQFKRFICTVFTLLLLANMVYGQPTEQWIRMYNNSVSDQSRFIAVDNSGNCIVSGYNQFFDIVTVKYDPSGNILWTNIHNADGPAELNGLAVDNSGNIILAGADIGPSGNTDMLILKIGSGGTTLWLARYNSAFNLNDKAMVMVLDNTGSIFVSGYSGKTLTTTQLTTVKYNSVGVQQWVNAQNTNTNRTYALDIDIDALGNIYICGTYGVDNLNQDAYLFKISPVGTFAFFTPYNNNSVTGSDGFFALVVNPSATAVFVTGFSDSTTTSSDQITARFNSSGARQWLMRYNGPGNGSDYGGAIVLDSAGNVYSAGSSTGSGLAGRDIEISKYSSAGVPMGYQRYNANNQSESFQTMKIDAANNLYIAGNTTTALNGSDVILLKYNPSLTMLWSKTYDGIENNNDLTSDIVLDNSGNIFLGGSTYFNSTGTDYLTIKYSQPVGIEGSAEIIPAAFTLHQNYPNPFNPATEITFDIPSCEMVNISVFDVMGKEIAVLADDFFNAGSHNVSFDATGFSSGMYFYRISAGSFKDVKKMVLIK